MTSKKKSAGAARAMKVVPARRTLVLLESGLLLGLAEGIMEEIITHLSYSPYVKALLLMGGVLGVFALAIRILEPVIRRTLHAVSKLDSSGGAMMRLGLHLVIFFLIFVGYLRVFFPTAH